MSQKHHALYIRVSTEGQAEEGYSIQAQSQRLQAYCQAKGWAPYQDYIDGGYSGSNLERPQIRHLMDQVKKGQVASVLVYKLDRLSRSQKDTLYLIEDVFLPQQVDFISLNESIDTTTPYGRAMIGILSAFAQLERENIYQRTRMGMLERVKQGFWMGGGSTPFGYVYDSQQGILLPHPTQAETVRQVYALYLQGHAPQKIADRLDLGYDRLVMQIINRRSNLGLISYKGKEYPGRHQPLITPEVFHQAQEMRRRRGRGQRPQGQHLLSGLIYCKGCGARLRYQRWGQAGYKLRCYSQDPSKAYLRHQGQEACTAPPVWAQEVEDIVLADFQQITIDLASHQPQSQLLLPQESLAREISQQEHKLKRLYQLYAQGEEETLMETISSCQVRLESLRQALEEAQEEEEARSQQEAQHQQVFVLAQRWDQLDLPQKQRVLQDCIQGIHLLGEEVEIHYRFFQRSPGKEGEG